MTDTKMTTKDGVAIPAVQTAPGPEQMGESPPTFSDPFTKDRRQSDEWDASKVPPSRFQKRKGSIYSTPNSRDGHVDRNYAAKFHDLHSEKYSKKG
ncbi:hypothetical protein RB595_001968 [Gaeumannomyces hyphopodioides]